MTDDAGRQRIDILHDQRHARRTPRRPTPATCWRSRRRRHLGQRAAARDGARQLAHPVIRRHRAGRHPQRDRDLQGGRDDAVRSAGRDAHRRPSTTGTARCTTSLAPRQPCHRHLGQQLLHRHDRAGVVVSAPPAGSYVNLGGKFAIGSSAGTYKADDGSSAKVNVDINAEDNGPRAPSAITSRPAPSPRDRHGLAERARRHEPGRWDVVRQATERHLLGFSSFRGSATLTDVTKGGPRPPSAPASPSR